jgi:hypothetical protein
MPKVQGVREKLHYSWYDAFFVPPTPQGEPDRTFASEMTRRDPRVIRFFVDVQNKTRLETNMQSAGVLPSLNTFETRAMRVVISSINEQTNQPSGQDTSEHAKVQPGILVAGVTEADIIAELIYNSVTTFLVGDKTMYLGPTFLFPAGAGVIPSNTTVSNHGEPDPMATFRFAEPVTIECQQSFQVEISFPQGVPGQAPVPGNLANVRGPFRLWVVLDGYLTRDVQ